MAYTDEQIRTTKELLKQLRTTKGLSYERLASLIEEKENVPISRGALQYYEIIDEDHERYKTTQGMSIEYLVALADFYGVSVDFLLGRTPCKEATNKEINKRLALSDEAINNVEHFVKRDFLRKKDGSIKRSEILSSLLANDYFMYAIENIAFAIENLPQSSSINSVPSDSLVYRFEAINAFTAVLQEEFNLKNYEPFTAMRLMSSIQQKDHKFTKLAYSKIQSDINLVNLQNQDE